MSDAVIEVRDLAKTYRTPFARRLVQAVRGISFRVERGEVFGFLGPNGAGKTTTIRMLMGLVRPTAGSAAIFGHPVPSTAARARLGFLPEAPYFYEYLTASELLDLTGRLFGLEGAERRRRTGELIEMVGLSRARFTPLKKYSKGMLQRAGIAQALINDPELVVFDEPMSGLDPMGRKEVRDIINRLRDAGKTVFFSSHILADVEMVSDRVAIVVRGQIHDIGALSQLVQQRIVSTDVVLRATDTSEDGITAAEAALRERVGEVRRVDRELAVSLPADADVDELLAWCREHGLRVHSVTPRHDTLEDLFIRAARSAA